MSKRRPYIGPSEAQANADALYRRSAPFTEAASASVRVAWDWRQRQPRDLREAVRMARAAYADEVPPKLHETAIGPDGTPRMTARAEGYIFGSGTSDDAPRNPETDERDPIGYYHAPFRARLAELSCGSEQERKRAAIVSHVTIGSMEAVQAAIAEDVPSWCAKLVAQDALFFFLHSMSDLKLHLPRQEPLEGTVTAA
jgi:hypothetical protein